MNQTIWMVAIACCAGLSCGKPTASSVEAEGGKSSEGDEQRPAQQAACGKALCAAGEVCCNPSCGICTARDGMCTQQFCDDAPPPPGAGEPPVDTPHATCDNVRCAAGTHCELVEVQCIRAPCDPVPQCRPDGVTK